MRTDDKFTIKRVDGTVKEIHAYKKGKTFGTLEDVETELWRWSQTVPEGEKHRVSYEITRGSESTMYGVFGLGHLAPTEAPLALRESVLELYGVEL